MSELQAKTRSYSLQTKSQSYSRADPHIHVLLQKTFLKAFWAARVPSHQQQLRDCRCISAWEPRPCPEGSRRVSQNPCSEDASKRKLSQSTKPVRTGRFDKADLLVGFVADFGPGWWKLGGGRMPGDFLFSAGGFFRRIFLLRFATKTLTAKIHRKIRHFYDGLLEDFHSRLKPRPAVSKFQVQLGYPP